MATRVPSRCSTPKTAWRGQSGSVQLSLSADVYQYVVFYALCQETDQYGNLQSYLCDTDPKTSLLRNAISNYSDTDEPDDPDEPYAPSQRNRPQDHQV